ncbi:MAG: Crp/Fnr family transcriptional regulator [Bacteroidetes bacterium]|nr:MAG: Crp/Fnr family transcriptional regulator [Bacteroidota bacterium]
MNKLHEHFSRIFNSFEEQTVTAFAQAFNYKEFKKGEYLLKEGEYCNHLTFILKGAMMCYYLKDGKQYIDEFSLDHEFITDYTSFLTHSPSNKNIQCLEDCKVYVLSNESLNQLYQTNSANFERLGRVMAEQLYLQWHEKSKSLLMDNATERYLKLIQNRAELPQRVPQYLIAEYLGITPESLSRIRKTSV